MWLSKGGSGYSMSSFQKYEKYMCLSKKIRVLTLSRFKRQKIKLVNSDGQRLASKAKPKTMITSSFKSIWGVRKKAMKRLKQLFIMWSS